MLDHTTQSQTASTPEVLDGGNARTLPAGAKRVLSYVVVAALSATLGWWAQPSAGQEASLPLGRLDVAQSGITLTTSGDLQAQMTVVNYGSASSRLTSLRIDGQTIFGATLIVGPGESAAIDIPVTCETVRKRGEPSQVAVEFVTEGGRPSQFGYLAPRAVMEACAQLGRRR